MNLYIFSGKELITLRLNHKGAVPRIDERVETVHIETGRVSTKRVVGVKWVYGKRTAEDSCTVELGD